MHIRKADVPHPILIMHNYDLIFKKSTILSRIFKNARKILERKFSFYTFLFYNKRCKRKKNGCDEIDPMWVLKD